MLRRVTIALHMTNRPDLAHNIWRKQAPDVRDVSLNSNTGDNFRAHGLAWTPTKEYECDYEGGFAPV